MKVGILTFPKSPSYGASLQMYALFKFLKSNDFDVEVINYQNTYMKNAKHILNSNKRLISKISLNLLNIPMKVKFTKFEKNISFYPKKCISELANMQEIADRYDAIICGSDQVWNHDIIGKDLNYFLAFCDTKVRKISYAPSFGYDNVEKYNFDIAFELINTFNHISVREKSGALMIYEMLNINVPIVCDPTLLLNTNEWVLMEKKINLPEKFILKFIFNYDENVEKYLEKLEKEMNIPVLILGGHFGTLFKKGKHLINIGPREWLYAIHKATIVVTDSFHGLIFSIIYNKEVYVSLKSKTNTRLKMLVSKFDLENNVIMENFKRNNIDYDKIYNIKKEFIENSSKFLINALK